VKLLIDCDCGADILKVEKIWEDKSKGQYLIWLCMYKGGSMHWWNRVKASWNYFLYGEFFYNDITLDQNQMDEFINFLNTVKASEVV